MVLALAYLDLVIQIPKTPASHQKTHESSAAELFAAKTTGCVNEYPLENPEDCR